MPHYQRQHPELLSDAKAEAFVENLGDTPAEIKTDTFLRDSG